MINLRSVILPDCKSWITAADSLTGAAIRCSLLIDIPIACVSCHVIVAHVYISDGAIFQFYKHESPSLSSSLFIFRFLFFIFLTSDINFSVVSRHMKSYKTHLSLCTSRHTAVSSSLYTACRMCYTVTSCSL